jgi:hypothetical protein
MLYFVDLYSRGRCSSDNAAVTLRTYVDGAELKWMGFKAPQLPYMFNYQLGPKLRYLSERTKFHWGWWCSGKSIIPEIIPTNSIAEFSVGNSKGALAKPEVDICKF